MDNEIEGIECSKARTPDKKNNSTHVVIDDASYQGLKYKTKDFISPRDLSKVYFCCHEQDFKRLFGTITDEILQIYSNAAIWYYDPIEGIPRGALFETDLARMQLFIVPITRNFLSQENSACRMEFMFALEQHIPVLPLIQESGLENTYSRVCGKIHYIDKKSIAKDPSALPFEKRIKDFFNEILINDECVNRIRREFDAYIFLSYRKKDRLYAQKIMQIIHRNESCRDVAIWYDEFLIPGEDFNDNIMKMIEKSTLFALVVTPNLLEIPNYVMRIEYPEACSQRKTILAVMAKDTEIEKISMYYPDIECISYENEDKVFEVLNKVFKWTTTQDNRTSPEHLYYIGLAYLSGIDVETNYNIAIPMITEAAKNGCLEAYDKVASLSRYGNGVSRNIEKYFTYKTKYIELLKIYIREKKEQKAFLIHKILDSMHELCSAYYEERKLRDYLDAAVSFKDYVYIELIENDTITTDCSNNSNLVEYIRKQYIESLRLNGNALEQLNLLQDAYDISKDANDLLMSGFLYDEQDVQIEVIRVNLQMAEIANLQLEEIEKRDSRESNHKGCKEHVVQMKKYYDVVKGKVEICVETLAKLKDIQTIDDSSIWHYWYISVKLLEIKAGKVIADELFHQSTTREGEEKYSKFRASIRNEFFDLLDIIGKKALKKDYPEDRELLLETLWIGRLFVDPFYNDAAKTMYRLLNGGTLSSQETISTIIRIANELYDEYPSPERAIILARTYCAVAFISQEGANTTIKYFKMGIKQCDTLNNTLVINETKELVKDVVDSCRVLSEHYRLWGGAADHANYDIGVYNCYSAAAEFDYYIYQQTGLNSDIKKYLSDLQESYYGLMYIDEELVIKNKPKFALNINITNFKNEREYYLKQIEREIEEVKKYLIDNTQVVRYVSLLFGIE